MAKCSRKFACRSIPEAKAGDYTFIHVELAFNQLYEEARKSLETLQEFING